MPPDRLQTRAIIDLLIAFNWTYVSMIGTYTDYSWNGINKLKELAEENGICIAYFVEITPVYEDRDYDNIIRQLRTNHKAHVVVTFIHGASKIWSALKRQKAEGEFIVVGGDTLSINYDETINSVKSDITVLQSHSYNEFEKYYSTLFPLSFFKKLSFFEKALPSDLAKSQCNITLPKGINGSCLNYERMDQLPNYELFKYHRKTVDALNVFISSLDALIRQNCPFAFLDKSYLSTCIKGPELLKIVRSSSFMGYGGKIHFDKQGDGIYDYDIWQRQPDGQGGYQSVVI